MDGHVDTLGAVTGRCTHNSPNLAQVPAVSKDKDDNILLGLAGKYGKECRELFIPRAGFKLVGCDGSGLELRMLAHYMNDEEYTDAILNGDIHTKNQQAAGLPTRNNAKTFIYGFLYGAGDAKVGSITGKGAKEGKIIKNRFLASLPKLKKLSEGVKHKINTQGYLLGIDKRKLKVRESYKGLNVLLQSAGAIVMKKALCILDDDLNTKGWKLNEDYAFVLNIHDEIQAEVRPELVDEYMKMAVESIRKAGDYFNFRCPLDGEAKVGLNWCDTH
jgi:DNA polymerase I-like protein with 3'-5' exonuclease and polymerase domains